MKERKMSEQVQKLLEEHEINKLDICRMTATDMNTESEYADGYVILTGDKLCVLKSPASESGIRYFKGYGEREELRNQTRTWIMTEYPVSEIENLRLEFQVACGVLVAKINGTDIALTATSNLHTKDLGSLVRYFEWMKAPEKMAEPDETEEELYCPKCGHMYPDQVRKVCPKCMDRKSSFFRILKYFNPYKVKMIIMLLCILLTAALNLVWPYLNGTVLYDKILMKDNSFIAKLGLSSNRFVTALLIVVLTMFGVKVILLLLQILQGVFTAQMVSKVIRDIKKDVFRNMGRLSISFFHSRQTGSLMTRVMSDAERVTGFYFDGVPYIFINGFTIISSVTVMMFINWKMAIVSVLLLPILTYISMKLRPKIWVMYGRRHRTERSLTSNVNDNLTGARVVKSFGQEERETERFIRYNENHCRAEIAIAYKQNSFHLVYGAAQEIASIAIWCIGVFLVLDHNKMNVGTLITFAGYVSQLSGPMGFFARIFNWWTDSMNSAQRIFEIIDAVPDIVETENPVPLRNPKGEIVLKNVTFGYEPNRQILKNISLDIKGGSMLGIVGHSGAGKTTLVNLISRMYEPQEGTISIDGIDIQNLSFKDLRQNVAMVSQETYIFMGTVAENIAYAKKDATPSDILSAAKLAGAHDFIMRMPDGYDTRIGSSGRELSGGERQRISIARAILANPKILILDEATASVDTETERIIQKSLQYLVKGRTTISIAHRLSTLRDADYLVLIENGVITEQGTQEELIQLQGTYYKLLELQTKALALEEGV